MNTLATMNGMEAAAIPLAIVYLAVFVWRLSRTGPSSGRERRGRRRGLVDSPSAPVLRK